MAMPLTWVLMVWIALPADGLVSPPVRVAEYRTLESCQAAAREWRRVNVREGWDGMRQPFSSVCLPSDGYP